MNKYKSYAMQLKYVSLGSKRVEHVRDRNRNIKQRQVRGGGAFVRAEQRIPYAWT